MEFINILRVLWRRRLLVALGAAGAILIGLALAFQVSFVPPGITSRHAAVPSVASARVLIDAPGQRAIDLGSELAATIALRAVLLADLLMTDEMHAAIARDAGMKPRQIAVLGPSAGPPPLPITTAVLSADAARVQRERYVLELLADGQDPIVSIRATGLNPVGGARLVDAAAKGLQDVLASGRRVDGRSLRTQRLGPVTVRKVAVESRRPLALVAATIAFAFWCVAIVVLPALLRLRHFSLVPAGAPRAGGPR
ncbi:MAG: hypothetical protein ACRDLN_09265 [Solirubrobacteraceae bacterium]